MPLRVPGNVLDSVDDCAYDLTDRCDLADLRLQYLLSIALPFSRTGTMSERFTTTVVSKGGPEPDSTNVKNVRARFMAKAPDGETPSPTHFILPPPIHPSILPHILMSIPMGQLWCSEEVLRDGNVNRFAEAMLVYFTVVAHYIRDPTDSPDNHFIQLEVLSNRVELEAGRVRRRGPAVIPPELRGGFPPVSTVDSAIIMFEHARDFLRLKGWQYETFR